MSNDSLCSLCLVCVFLSQGCVLLSLPNDVTVFVLIEELVIEFRVLQKELHIIFLSVFLVKPVVRDSLLKHNEFDLGLFLPFRFFLSLLCLLLLLAHLCGVPVNQGIGFRTEIRQQGISLGVTIVRKCLLIDLCQHIPILKLTAASLTSSGLLS